MSRAKRWTVTLYNPAAAEELFEAAPCSKFVYQTEICPTTGRVHVQGYVEMETRMRLTQIKLFFPGAHLEVAKGTPLENYLYCTKTSSRDPLGPSGSKGDFDQSEPDRSRRKRSREEMENMIQDIKTGLPERAIARKYPMIFLRHSNGIPKLIHHYKPIVPTVREVSVIVIWGAPGTGKSHWAMQYARWHKMSYYNKPIGTWWGSYAGERCVFFNDFDGNQVPYRSLLTWLDVYPCDLDVKGGHVAAQYDTVIITSNVNPLSWYAEEDPNPLTRRIAKTHWATQDQGWVTDTLPFKEKIPARPSIVFEEPEEEEEVFEIEDMPETDNENIILLT